MPAFNKFHTFAEALAERGLALQSDTLRLLLTNTLPPVGASARADLAEIAAGNGYPAGGPQAVQASSAQTAGTYKLVLNDVTITAGGGAIGPFRYVVLYDATPAGGVPIGWFDYGSSITLGAGEPLTVDFDADTGVLQLS